MQTLHIQLLGNFWLRQGDEPVTSVNTLRLQALLAYLVLQRDRPVLRQQLAFQLWPNSSERQARTEPAQTLLPVAARLYRRPTAFCWPIPKPSPGSRKPPLRWM